MDLRVTIGLILFTTTTCAWKTDFRCPSNTNISAHSHPESCKKYYLCTFGLIEELTCPYTLYFDTVSLGCTFVDSVRCFEGTEVEKWDQPICANDGKVKMVPHQVICSKYYLCLGAIAVERRCQAGLLFDVKLRKCTNPGSANCHLDPWCPENDQLNDLRFFPDPENCARYSVCYNQQLHPLNCAEGFFFNLEMQECTFPGWSACKVRDVECTIESVYVPHPGKCQSYYECKSGFAFYRECEDGYFFSELELSCMPNNGQCTQQPASTSTEQMTTKVTATTSVPGSSSTVGSSTTDGTITTTDDGGGVGRLLGNFYLIAFVTVCLL